MKIEICEIRDINDPTQSGRVRLRAYCSENDEDKIKDEDLKWGSPVHPFFSAATAGVGLLPAGFVVGGRVVVCYADIDKNCEYPIILGNLPRGELPSKGGVRKQPDEDSGGETNTKVAAPDSPLPHPDYNYDTA